LGVAFVNDPPAVSFVLRQLTPAGVPKTANFHRLGPDAGQTLTVRAFSSNQKVLPDANIVLTPTESATDITMYPLTITAGQNAFIDLVATDNLGLSGTNTFELFVQPGQDVLLANPNPITINAGGTADPYPSAIAVSGLVGQIISAQVTLHGFSHPNPSDVSVLLVGPTGNVLLMGETGGSTAANGATLIFDDDGVPVPSPLVSGTYQPSGSITFNFPTNGPIRPPVAPYGDSLSVFANKSPNTNWYLYVVSKSPPGVKGLISNGWTLALRTTLNIQPIANISTLRNTPSKPVSVVVGDPQQSPTLTVTASWNDPNELVEKVDVTPSATPGRYDLVVTPTLWAYGPTNTFATITVTAHDSDTGDTDLEPFQFRVTFEQLPPVLDDIPNVFTERGVPSTNVTLRVWDPQGSNVTVAAVSSSDPNLVPLTNITVTLIGPDGPPFLGSQTNTYRMIFTPNGVEQGSTRITIGAVAGTKSTQKSFTANVGGNIAFAFTGAIGIPLGLPVDGTAEPYPAQINVNGLSGNVADINATLVGFSHTVPEDVNVLLVSPDNKKSVVLMGHAGGSVAANNLRITFDDQATPDVPDETALQSGSFRPKTYPRHQLPNTCARWTLHGHDARRLQRCQPQRGLEALRCG
jgi:hypothetical protein